MIYLAGIFSGLTAQTLSGVKSFDEALKSAPLDFSKQTGPLDFSKQGKDSDEDGI